jgi:hypothetical protein
MRHIFLIIIFLASFALAQQTLPIWHDSTELKREITVFSSAQIHSNHLSAPISRKILFGGFIDEAQISRSVDKLKENGLNRTGAIFSANFIFSDYTVNLFGKANLGLVINAGHQTYFGTTYRKDIFRLLALGNEQAPEISELADTRFYQMSHYNLGFGVLDKKTRSTFSLGLVGASGFQNFDLMNGIFRQNPNKDTTDIILIGTYLGNKSSPFIRGLGLALDVDLRMPVRIKQKDVLIQVLAQNAGFVRMNDKTFNYVLDTNFRYTGFNLQQIQDLANNEDFSLIDSLNIAPKNGNSCQWLPGFVQVAKIVNRNLDQKFQAFYGLTVYTQIIYMPQAFLGGHYKFNEKVSAGVHGHLGGFGGMRLGCYAEMRLGQFNMGLSSQDILGTAANLGFGHSLLFRISWQQK